MWQRNSARLVLGRVVLVRAMARGHTAGSEGREKKELKRR
jgi:hypothetical protein